MLKCRVILYIAAGFTMLYYCQGLAELLHSEFLLVVTRNGTNCLDLSVTQTVYTVHTLTNSVRWNFYHLYLSIFTCVTLC